MTLLADRKELLSFLQKNPKTTLDSLHKKSPKLYEALRFFYRGRINTARQDAGLDVDGKVNWAKRKEKLLEFLRRNPLCTIRDIRKVGLGSTAQVLYGHRLNEAKKDAGIIVSSIKSARKERRLQPKLKRIVEFLKKNPNAQLRHLRRIGLAPACLKVFKSLNGAKRAVGVIPSGWIAASEVARRRNVSRQCIGILIQKGKLSSMKIGRNTFLNIQEVHRYDRKLGRSGRFKNK